MTSNVLGGIGAGLMQGVQFINQRRQMDENAALRNRQVGLQEQSLQMQQEAFDLKKNEAQRAEALGTLKNEIAQQYPDATDPYQRTQLFIQKGVERNLFRGDELDGAYAARTKLRTEFGTQAYDAALAGDIKPLQTLLGERGMAVDYTPDRSALNIWSASGEKDAKGNPVPKRLSIEGLMQLDAMGAVRERELVRQKQNLEMQKYRAEFGKTQAETDRLHADAELKRATAAGKNEFTVDESGNVVRNQNYRAPGGKGKGADGALSFEDFGKAIAHYIPDGEEFNKADAYQLYLNAVESTNADRARRGLPSMTDGQTATLFSDVIDVARGKGVRTPNIGRDGSLALTADINGRTYTLDPDFTERQALELKDAEGKPRYTSESINDLYLDALRGSAVANPEEFKSAWLVANDPEVRSAIEQEAQKGSPEAIRALQAASTIMRGMDRARETAKVSDRSNWFADKQAPTFSDSERAAAAQFGVDPDRRGLGSYIAEGARKVGDAVGRVASAANRNFVENTQRKIRNTGRIEQGDAIAIVQHIRNTPELKSLFNDDELAAIQVAAQERI